MKITSLALGCLLVAPLFASFRSPCRVSPPGGGTEAKITEVGFGTPGLTGIPELTVVGAPVIGQPFAWRVDNGAPGAIGILYISENEVVLPLPGFGGEGYVGTPQFRKRFKFNPQGTKKGLFKQSSLDPSLCGIQIISQVIVFDAAAQGGVNLTAGLRLLVGLPASLGDDYEQPVSFPHGKCIWMEFAELDGDGLVDRLLLNDADVLAFAPGNGDGTFGAQSAQPLTLGSPDEVRLHDINNDGKLDLVVTHWAPDTLSVFLGLGGGAFGAENALALPVRPAHLTLLHLNLDGNPDAAMITTSGTVMTTLGNGDGTFGTVQIKDPGLATIGLSDRGIDSGDFDGDGLDDVVIAMHFPGKLAWFASDGFGGLGATQLLPTTAQNIYEVHVADYDDDGEHDLFATSDNGAYVALGDGAGNFVLNQIQLGLVRYLKIEALDQNNDGKLDIVAHRGFTPLPSVAVFRGGGSGLFEAPKDVGIGGALSVRLVDADQDGDLDFHGILSGGLIEKRTIGGAFDFGPVNHTPNPALQINFTPLYADFDSDGVRDALVFNNQGNAVQLFLELGAANPPAAQNLGIPFEGGPCGLEDLNGDGAMDLLVAGIFPNYGVKAYLGDGLGGFGSAVSSSLAPLSFECGFGDFDEDGTLDLATRTDDNIIKIWRGTGLGNFTFLFQQGLLFDFGMDIHVADFDGDGHIDVGSFSNVNDVFQVLLGQGDGSLVGPFDSAITNFVSYFNVRDETGDGLADLTYNEAGDIRVRPSLGNGLFGPGYLIPVDDGAFRWTWDDVNADGLDDLVTLRSTVPTLLWLHPSNGDGTYGTSRAFHSDVGATTPMIEDVNGDGLVDLVTVNRIGLRVILQE